VPRKRRKDKRLIFVAWLPFSFSKNLNFFLVKCPAAHAPGIRDIGHLELSLGFYGSVIGVVRPEGVCQT
jgi:hypothetical protein